MKNILVIDDEPSIQEIIGFYLISKGYSVFNAATSVEGLKAITENVPDLILVDLHLKGENGIEMIKMFREQGYDKGIIACSGTIFPGSPRVQEVLEAGATDMVQKPFFGPTLLAKVEEVFDRKEIYK